MSKTHASGEGSSTETSSAETAASAAKPVVLEVKKKKKYSSSTARSAQELEAGLTKSARRVAKAVREGLDEYADQSDASAAKKKDGVLRDHLKNQSKALRKALPIIAEAPSDILDSIADMKSVRKLFKK